MCRRRRTCGLLICIGLRLYFDPVLPVSKLFTCQCFERPAGREGEALNNAERRDGNDKHYSLTRAVARILFLGGGGRGTKLHNMKLYKNLLYFGNVPSYSKWLNLVRVLLTLKSFRSSMTSSDELNPLLLLFFLCYTYMYLYLIVIMCKLLFQRSILLHCPK